MAIYSWMAGCVGRCLGRLSPLIAWDLTPQQACNPTELAHCLAVGSLAYPSETQQLLALYWGFPCSSQAPIQYHQRTMVETGTQTTSGSTMHRIRTQTPTTVITLVVKKKHWIQRSTSPYHQLAQEEEGLIRKLVLQQENKRMK